MSPAHRIVQLVVRSESDIDIKNIGWCKIFHTLVLERVSEVKLITWAKMENLPFLRFSLPRQFWLCLELCKLNFARHSCVTCTHMVQKLWGVQSDIYIGLLEQCENVTLRFCVTLWKSLWSHDQRWIMPIWSHEHSGKPTLFLSLSLHQFWVWNSVSWILLSIDFTCTQHGLANCRERNLIFT